MILFQCWLFDFFFLGILSLWLQWHLSSSHLRTHAVSDRSASLLPRYLWSVLTTRLNLDSLFVYVLGCNQLFGLWSGSTGPKQWRFWCAWRRTTGSTTISQTTCSTTCIFKAALLNIWILMDKMLKDVGISDKHTEKPIHYCSPSLLSPVV